MSAAKRKNMLSRLIESLSGLPTDSVDDSSNRTSPGMPRSGSRGDIAHLTTSSSSQSLRQLSIRTAEDTAEPSDAKEESFVATVVSPTWNAIVGGAHQMLDSLLNIEDDDESSQEGSPRRATMSPRGPNNAYPVVRNESHAELTEIDEELKAAKSRLPTPLQPNDDIPLPWLSEPSSLMEDDHIRALRAEIPLRYQECSWTLLYSTIRDGISRQTLLRNGRNKAPTILIVRDMHKHIFGAYCSEPWRLAHRFYGTGETFVFQLQPQVVAWHWWWQKMPIEQNDYFMWGDTDAMAVGGSGGYAIWLDNELSQGLSRTCTTFGSECLAGKEEFEIGAVELWGLS